MESNEPAFGLQHTLTWNTLYRRLVRLVQCLQSPASMQQERQQEVSSFRGTLIEQAKQFSSKGSPPSSQQQQQTVELNSLALLAIAHVYDRLIGDRQQAVPQVAALLGDSLRANNDDVARSASSAWPLFVEQASSTLGSLGSLGTGWAAGAGGRMVLGAPSPRRLRQRDAERAEPASPVASPAKLGEQRAESCGLRRNGSSELFLSCGLRRNGSSELFLMEP